VEKRYDILAVGDVNIDLIFSGISHLPQFGAEVIAEGVSQHLGGCTANFAVFCARLGERVAFVSHVGRDQAGEFLLGELQRHGVVTEYVTYDEKLPTGITVSLSRQEDRAFVTYLGTIDSVRAEDVPDELLADSRHLHIGSYFIQSRLREGIGRLLERAKRAGLTISLDTGYDPAQKWDAGIGEILKQVDVFLPNELEAINISGVEDVEKAALALARAASVVVVKLGGKGCLAVRGEEVVRVPAFSVDVVDTTCCGDAFNAGFLRSWLRGKDIEHCLKEGNAAGAIVAGSPGNSADRLSVEAVESLAGTAQAAQTGR